VRARVIQFFAEGGGSSRGEEECSELRPPPCELTQFVGSLSVSWPAPVIHQGGGSGASEKAARSSSVRHDMTESRAQSVDRAA